MVTTPEKNGESTWAGYTDEDLTISATLKDNNGTAKDVSGGTVTFEAFQGKVEKISPTAATQDNGGTDGKVSYVISSGTLTKGTYSYYFKDADGFVYPWEGAKGIIKIIEKGTTAG